MSKAAELAALIGSQTALSHRNIIINGAMQVAQRGTVTGITSGNYGGPDRIKTQPSGLGTWTVEQSTDAPDGFSNSFKLTCTTADSSPAAGDYIQLRFITEGQNVQHLDYGSSGALATTISFYVKSSKTGTFTYVLRTFDSGAGTRLFSKNVTISSANTWEYKTVTAPGDASGAINNDNTMGLDAAFWLNAGSTFSGGSEQATWANQNNSDKYLGTIDLGNATNETFQITGVQLEVGEQATPFEHRSFADEMYRCRRYFYKSFNYDTAPENGGASGVSFNGGLLGYCGSNNSGTYSAGVRFDPEMRATPTVVTYGNSSGHWGRLSPTNTGTVTFSSGSGYMSNIKASGLNFGQNAAGDTLLIGFGHITADAEL